MEELPTASQARELSYESAIKRLDRYVNEAIAHGETRRHFDFNEISDGGLLIIENIDKVAQHFNENSSRNLVNLFTRGMRIFLFLTSR